MLDHFLRRKSPDTLDAYTRDITAFAKHVGVRDSRAAASFFLTLDGARANRVVLDWLQTMTEAGLSSATIARRLAAIRSLTKMGRMLGVVTWTIEVQSPKVRKYRDTAGCGMEAVRKMVTACEHPRDEVALLILGTLAIRRRGLLNARVRDYDADKRRLFVRDKGDKSRWMRVPAIVVRAIEAWLREHPRRDDPDAPLICGLKDGRALKPQAVNHIVAKAGRAIGVHAWPHGVRHSVASKFANEKKDVRDIAKLLGHTDIRNTMHYIDAAEDPTEDMSRELGELFESEEG